MNGRALMVAVALLALGGPAQAHRPSDAFVTLAAGPDGVAGNWEIALRDVAALLEVDADGDGALTWGELRRSQPALERVVASALAIDSDAGPCPLDVTALLVNERLDGPYAHLALRARCAGEPASLAVRYRLLFDLDPTHRGLLVLRTGELTHGAVFSPEHQVARFEAGRPSTAAAFADFFREGVHHIWIGIDHVLFLVALLLPAVLLRQDGRWRPAPCPRAAAADVVAVVTAFTLAHSVTLSLSALDVLRVPSALTESAIALSVVLAALNNLWPVVTRWRWAVAGGFGLVHGFGFASALGELGLPDGARLLALAAFNLGVEAGQLAIVLALLPAAWLARGTAAYGAAVTAGSAAVALAGMFWLSQRVADSSMPALIP